MDERPAQILDGILLVDLLDLIEEAVDRADQRRVLVDGHPGLGDLARDAAPLREIFRLRGRFQRHHVVADRLIEMLAIGVEVEIRIALEHGLLQIGDFRDGRIRLLRIACGNGRQAVETDQEPAFRRPFLIGIEVFGWTRSADRRETDFGHVPHHRHVARFILRLGRIWPGFRNRAGTLDGDNPGRPALGVALDPRIGLLVEAHRLDGLAVHIGAAPRELQLHRIVRRDLIELFAGKVLLVVGELIGREAAERIDPLAGF